MDYRARLGKWYFTMIAPDRNALLVTLYSISCQALPFSEPNG